MTNQPPEHEKAAEPQVELLSGGNPRIAKADGDEAVDRLDRVFGECHVRQTGSHALIVTGP